MASEQSAGSADPHVSDYRLAPLVVARFVGASLVGVALLMFVGTALVAVLEWPADLLVALLVLAVAGVFALAWWLRSRVAVVHLDSTGYRVRMVRGAGTTAAAWSEVTELATVTTRGIPCVVLRLADGRTTTIPVEVLTGDREAFVRDLRAHLQRGEGLRPL
jgi:hypothetical protein